MKSPFSILAAPFLTLLLATPSIAGENITFPGNGTLAIDPQGFDNSLFPGTSLSNNTVTVENGAGAIGGYVYGGITASSDDVTGNSVVIKGGTIGTALSYRGVYGGFNNGNGNVTGNSVSIEGASVEVHGSVFGGQQNGNPFGGPGLITISGNSVSITNGAVVGDAYGGFSSGNDDGETTDNSVSVSGGTVGGSLYGGSAAGSTSGQAMRNSVNLSGGEVSGGIYGGFASGAGDSVGNRVSMTGGTVGNDVAGVVNFLGNGVDNSVSIAGGLVGGNVYGAQTIGGHNIGNSVSIMGGRVTGDVYAGSTQTDGDNTGNSVSITDGTVGGTVYGGYGMGDGANISNKVIMSGGAVSVDVIGAENFSGTDIDNTVIIAGGSVGGDVYGARNNLAVGATTGNNVAILGGSVVGDVYGAMNLAGDNIGDSVTMTGGSVGGNVYGGYTDTSGDNTGNSVAILGGSVNGDVYGGYAVSGTATQNVVTIGAVASLTAGTHLWGGFSGSGGDGFTGNTLSLQGYQGTVSEVKNFEFYNFVLPAHIANAQSMLTVLTSADLTDGAGQSSSIGMGVMSGGRAFQVGEKFILIDASAGSLTTSTDLNRSATAQKGLFLLYDFGISRENNTIVATLVGAQTTPEAKALSEGRIADTAFINQGADLIADQGLDMAAVAIKTPDSLQERLAVFGVVNGGSSRYDTGSHVDLDGFSLITGLAWNVPLESNQLILSPFFEAGWGNYDSYNAFSNAASVKGNGDTNYYGGGVMARYKLTEGKFAGLYAEGSLRVGRVSTDFASNDLRDGLTGQRASYDSASAYYGAHAGLGYVLLLNDRTTLDVSSKYLWTHQNSDSVTVANDPIRFQASDSHRWRNGARLNYAVTEQFVWYVGAYYEYEFDGKARATAYGYDIDAPTLKGGTGTGELGIRFTPVAKSNLSLNLGVQGHVGVREGVNGRFGVTYRF